MTHEEFIKRIAQHVIEHAPETDRERISKARVMYGAGQPALRGVTYFDRWTTCDGEHVDLVEICALGESDPVQLAGTTVHELAHVAAGLGAGHDKDWKDACERLGLRLPKAADMRYQRANLRADIRHLIDSILPADGTPNGFDPITGLRVNLRGAPVKPRPCPMGIGTRGGKSRGAGSGSRMRKYVCQCEPKPVIVRAATDTLAAHCDHCKAAFTLA